MVGEVAYLSVDDAERAEMAQANGLDDAELRRLAALPFFQYERERIPVAEKLGVRVSKLDAAVEKFHPAESADAAEMFVAIEPWPEPVDGNALLDQLVAMFRRYMVLPPGAAEAIALWVLFTHLHDRSTISPILAVVSPTPECGKTTLLTLLSALVPKPLPASNITAAALFREVEKSSPTLLIDEADTFLRGSEDLRGVLNSGHNRRLAYIIRCVGDEHEPTRFKTWCPKCIALIGKLPPTLASRSIHIALQRMTPGDHVEIVRSDRLEHLTPLARQAARWAADTKLNDDPDMPAHISGRRADNWRPLLAIADAAGGEWPQRARNTMDRLSTRDDGQTTSIMLLHDLRTIFGDTESISSHAIVQALAEMEDRPWPEWQAGKPITTRQLARTLEPFGIRPRNLKIQGAVFKGYRLDDLADAFERYLSPVPATQSATPLPGNNSNDLPDIQSATTETKVADQSAHKPLKDRPGSDVADRDTENRVSPTWSADL